MSSKFASALLVFTILCPVLLWAQFSELPKSSKSNPVLEDYLFPIQPGVTNTLAGTMGELRNTHFHSGLDIRTNNMTGAAVVAAQQGYVSRVIRSTYSYGNVIFITHPDSNTTLYAHLDKINGDLGEHIKREQYKQKTFEIDLKFSPGEFPVSRGDTIALSGNTGSSNGPHLHFDIRDKDMNALNPLDFDFEEIPDKTKILVQKVALQTMDANSRINGRYGRFEFNVLKVGSDYVLPKPILAHGKIGVEVRAYDKMDNSRFQCGINTIEMKADSQMVFRQFIDKINMPVTRGILALFDYNAFKQTGHRYNKLFIQDGNPLDFYKGTVDRGVISVVGKDIPVHILMQDGYRNTTHVRFTLKNDPIEEVVRTYNSSTAALYYSVDQNILHLTSKVCKDSTASFFVNGDVMNVKPAYTGTLSSVFLYDLRNAIPDSVERCGDRVRFLFNDEVPSATEYTYYGQDFSVYFPDSALFDTLYFKASVSGKENAEAIRIGDTHTPLMRDIKVEWKPKSTYDDQKCFVYRVNGGNRYTNLLGKWKNGKVEFWTREFGEFTILPDTTPPSIQLISCNQSRARFKILDNLSGIYSFEATVNGEWLLMNYEHKTGVIWSEKLDNKVPIKGEFKLKVTDAAGNEKIYTQKII